MRERLVFPILLIIGLSLYLPILGTGTFILDDKSILSQAKSLTEKPFVELFIRNGGGSYYRPLLMLSFFADVTFWGEHPSIMHFVNILLHVVNAFLVYLNVHIFYPKQKNSLQILPISAAILFLVHPINTESINWISGRTDPLATFFTLIATYLTLSSTQNLKKHRLWIASLFLILGSMSKEVAFFSFPAITLFLLFYKPKQHHSFPCPNLTWRLTAIAPFLLGALTYLFMRSGSLRYLDKGITKVIDVEAYQSPALFSEKIITDFGFYIKKLFIPQPLTLAIDQVSPHYFWVGIIAILLFLLLMLTRNHLMGMTLLITLTIFPALLNALLHLAWTAYAERYLYLPSAFLCIALTLPHSFNKTSLQQIQKVLLILLICLFLPTTINRNLLWSKPLELTQLTHQQNLGNPKVSNMYAVTLANNEFYDKARAEFKKVLRKHPDNLYTYYSLANMELYINEPDASRATLEIFFNDELKPNQNILQVMLESNLDRLEMARHVESYQEIRTELIDTQSKLYAIDNKRERLLEIADLAILNTDYETAETNLNILLKNEETTTALYAKASSRLKRLAQKDSLP